MARGRWPSAVHALPAMEAWATEHGWQYTASEGDGRLSLFAPSRHMTASRFRFALGAVRDVAHVVRGEREGWPFTTFVARTASKANDNTLESRGVIAVRIGRDPFSAPRVLIQPESTVGRAADDAGLSIDIDFESFEFSRTFAVKGADTAFAYEVCHPRAMEHLLTDPRATVHVEGQWLVRTTEATNLTHPDEAARALAWTTALAALVPARLLDDPRYHVSYRQPAPVPIRQTPTVRLGSADGVLPTASGFDD